MTSHRQGNQQPVTKWRRYLVNSRTNFHEDDRAGRVQHIKDGSERDAGETTDIGDEKNGNLSCLSERIKVKKKQDLYYKGIF